MAENDLDIEAARKCFVIGPIGNRHAAFDTPERDSYEEALEVFESVIVPACKSVGLTAVRADQIALPGEITDQIFRRLRDDDVVIADVSGANANVMYELGLRHTTGKLTIQIGEYGQLPFDVSSIRTIQFSRSARGLIDARKALAATLEAGLLNAIEPTSAMRIWSERPQKREVDEASQGDVESVELTPDERDGLLDNMLGIEEGFPQLTEAMSIIEGAITDMGTISDGFSKEMDQLSHSEGSAKVRLTFLAKYARAIEEPSAKLEVGAKAFAERMRNLDADMLGLIERLREQPDLAEAEQVQGFIDMVSDLADTARSAMEGVSGMAEAASGLGGVSKILREPGRKINNSIRTMVTATGVIDEWDRQLTQLRK